MASAAAKSRRFFAAVRSASRPSTQVVRPAYALRSDG
jgi:hypothetical protein